MPTSSSMSVKIKFLGVWIATPYIVGCLISSFVFPDETFDSLLAPTIESVTGRRLGNIIPAADAERTDSRCWKQLDTLLGLKAGDADPFFGLPVMLHRNGDPTECDSMDQTSILPELQEAYEAMFPTCPISLRKHQVDALLTKVLNKFMSRCVSQEPDRVRGSGLLGFCDMGPKKTPIMLDHNQLVPVTTENGRSFLPCHFHTREGLRLTQLSDLVKIASADPQQQHNCLDDGNASSQTCQADYLMGLHLYAVPAGRVFMFAPKFVGELFRLPHVPGANDENIYLEVLSMSPRVFDVFNFFSRDESADLVERAQRETRDSHRIKRSSTGASGYNINPQRTSESGFDTHGETSMTVKKRCFKALGFDEYLPSYDDGLQILRYNITTAYKSHMDWITDSSGNLEHNFDSAGTGGNRFATILLYMSDLNPDDGGETVFPEGWPVGQKEEDRVDLKKALSDLRASDKGNVLKTGSWEETMVAQCRTRLAIRPHSSRAVLFYSQHPNGESDKASLHGACPVLSGQKYAANLWVWNTPRQGYAGAPLKKGSVKQDGIRADGKSMQIKAKFKNSGSDPSLNEAQLFYEDTFWGKMGPNDPELAVNTFQSHRWNLRVGKNVVKSWVINDSGGANQQFTV